MKIFALMIAVMFALACGGSKAAETASETPAEQPDAAPESASTEPVATAETAADDILANDGTRQIGEVTKCPVSGDIFTISDESAKAEHDGGTYYMCCAKCVAKFEADPAKYLASGYVPEGGHADHEEPSH